MRLVEEAKDLFPDAGVEELGPRRVLVDLGGDPEAAYRAAEKIVEKYGETGLYPVTVASVDKPHKNEIIVNHEIWVYWRGLFVLRTHLPRENPSMKSLAPILPGFAIDENEQYDLMGVFFRDHPGLKNPLFKPVSLGKNTYPLRKDWAIKRRDPKRLPERIEPEPPRSVVGCQRVVHIPMGPQHPALHEPIAFRLYVEGETIVGVEPVVGFNHRGIEKLVETKNYHQALHICGRVCGICNNSHTMAFVDAVEAFTPIKVPERARWLRVLALELERIHSHMLVNAVMAEVIGYDTLFMYIMRDREYIMQAKELLTGNRVLSDYIVIGGVKRDLKPGVAEKIKKIVEKTIPRLEHYKKVFMEDPLIRKRLEDVGRLKPRDIVGMGLLGPVARASGVKTDVRKEDPHEIYDQLEWEMKTRDEGDSLARMLLRWDEALESAKMILQILERLPQGNPVPRAPWMKFPPGTGISRVEAPRGELTYYIESDGKPRPYRVKIRTPSVHNVYNGSVFFRGAYLADAPVILVSYDPCISCMERYLVVDIRSNKKYLGIARGGELRLKPLSS